jgi:hypothetical protein
MQREKDEDKYTVASHKVGDDEYERSCMGHATASIGTLLGNLGSLFACFGAAPYIRVPMNHRGVVYRFEKYHRTLLPGVHYIQPLVERVKLVNVGAYEIVGESKTQYTSNGIGVDIKYTLSARIKDVIKALFHNIPKNDGKFTGVVGHITQSALRDWIGKHTIDEVLKVDQKTVESEIVPSIEKEMGIYGLDVVTFRVYDIDPPKEYSTLLVTHQTRMTTATHDLKVAQMQHDAMKVWGDSKTALAIRSLETLKAIAELNHGHRFFVSLGPHGGGNGHVPMISVDSDATF